MLDALTRCVVHPAVVRAAQAVIGGDPELEVEAAVGAPLGDETQATLAVSEQCQVLAKNCDGGRP